MYHCGATLDEVDRARAFWHVSNILPNYYKSDFGLPQMRLDRKRGAQYLGTHHFPV